MTALLGWFLITLVFGLCGLVLLWPAYRIARRRQPQRRGLGRLYLAAAAASGVALWFALPWIIHALFGRAGH